jgi:hypothetical protein
MYVKSGCVVFRMNARLLRQYELGCLIHTKLPCELAQTWKRFLGIVSRTVSIFCTTNAGGAYMCFWNVCSRVHTSLPRSCWFFQALPYIDLHIL